jgi:hypothetical protein
MNPPSDLLMQLVVTRCVLGCEVSQPAHGVANEVCEEMMTLLVGSRQRIQRDISSARYSSSVALLAISILSTSLAR